MTPSLSEEAEHLRLAERHITEGEVRVSEQRLLIARLVADARCTVCAEEVLQLLEATLAEMVAHREIILGAIRQAEAEGKRP